MAKNINYTRLGLFVFTMTFVVGMALLISYLARGYRFTQEAGLTAHGILAIKSDPTSSKVFIDGIQETTTDDNLSILPGEYDVEVRKDGFLTWKKRLTITKEEVTEVTANLFKAAPSLDAITYTGAVDPLPSRDFTKVLYRVPLIINGETDTQTAGLWILETINLPIGFSREPRRITDGDLTDVVITWSPDDRELLLERPTASYLLQTDTFTPQTQLVALTATQKTQLLADWKEELDKKYASDIKKLPDELEELLANDVSQSAFSPDKDLILYTASAAATLSTELVTPIPGASTQPQERDIKPGHTYVYDIEEDRNFLIDDASDDLVIEGGYQNTEAKRRLTWFPSSRNLVLAADSRVVIMDHDGTNQQTIFSGGYTAPFAFPTVSDDRIILLTNFGATDTLPNLYTVNLK